MAYLQHSICKLWSILFFFIIHPLVQLSTIMTFVAQVRICVFRPSPFPSVAYSVLMKLHEKLFLFCRKTIPFLDLGVTIWRRLSWNLRYRAIKSAVSESPNRKRVPMSLVHFSLLLQIFISHQQSTTGIKGLKTKAVARGDDLVISGQKMWITNGMQADWCLVLANTDTRPELAPHRNKSLIVVPMKERGIERRIIDKMGCRSSDTAQLFFDEVSNIMMKIYLNGTKNCFFPSVYLNYNYFYIRETVFM